MQTFQGSSFCEWTFCYDSISSNQPRTIICHLKDQWLRLVSISAHRSHSCSFFLPWFRALFCFEMRTIHTVIEMNYKLLARKKMIQFQINCPHKCIGAGTKKKIMKTLRIKNVHIWILKCERWKSIELEPFRFECSNL